MIRVTIHAESNLIDSFKVEGHAGYAKEGYDVVCSAVSAITQTAVLGLKAVLNRKIDYLAKEGFLSCKLVPDSDTQIILVTMLEGLKDIKRQYPRYLNIKEI